LPEINNENSLGKISDFGSPNSKEDFTIMEATDHENNHSVSASAKVDPN